MTLTAFNRRRRELAAEAARAEPEAEAAADGQVRPLDQLTKAELLEVAANTGVEVAASAPKAQIIEALLAKPAAENELE